MQPRARPDGELRARRQAERIGSEIRLARSDLALTRAAAARRAGVAPDTARRVEAGDPSVTLETLCSVAGGVGLDIVVRAYPARPPGLRDSGQLRLAEQVCDVARARREATLEMPAGEHGEAVDLALFGPQEVIAVEIERLVLDFQAQYRRAARKRDNLTTRHSRPVRLVLVIEDTRRNRAAVADHAAFLRQLLPAGSREILGALRSGRPLGRDGLLWLRRRR
jgi:transcriptional regulator with XRE-family HTH domain